MIATPATMAASCRVVGHANQWREPISVERTLVSSEAHSATDFSSNRYGASNRKGQRAAITACRKRPFSKLARAVISTMEDVHCSSFVSGRVECSRSISPHFRILEAKRAMEEGVFAVEVKRRNYVTAEAAATAAVVQRSTADECATVQNHTENAVSWVGQRKDEPEGKNADVNAEADIMRREMRESAETGAVVEPRSKGTLIGGINGCIRQNGKIILPHFTISEAKETEEVCRVLEQESRWTLRVDRAFSALCPKLHTRILARILKRQTKPSLAWKLFQQAESLTCFMHDSHTFYALIEVLGKAEDLPALWTLIDDMRLTGIRIKPIPFTFLISSYGRAGKIKEAEITLHSMREFNCKPNVYTYNAMLYALLKAKKTERALFTYSKMLHHGCRPDSVTFNTLISGLCLNDHTKLAACFLEEMLKQGFSPDIRICNRLISAYLSSGQLEEALNVYETAVRKGCEPNTVTHTMLLDWLFKMGKSDDALVLFREMVNSGRALDSVAYTAFLHGLFKASRAEMALAFFEALVKKGDASVGSFNVVVDWFCKHQNLDRAVEVLQDMRRRGVLADTFTFNSLIRGAFKDGRPQLGLAFASQMIDEGCAPDLVTYTLLMDFFLKKGELDDALVLMKEMTDNGYEPDTVIYNPVILGLFRAGKDEMALSTAREMMQKGCRPNKMTYRVLTSWLCKQGQSKEAVEFRKDMASLGCNPSLLQLSDASELLPVQDVM